MIVYVTKPGKFLFSHEARECLKWWVYSQDGQRCTSPAREIWEQISNSSPHRVEAVYEIEKQGGWGTGERDCLRRRGWQTVWAHTTGLCIRRLGFACDTCRRMAMWTLVIGFIRASGICPLWMWLLWLPRKIAIMMAWFLLLARHALGSGKWVALGTGSLWKKLGSSGWSQASLWVIAHHTFFT